MLHQLVKPTLIFVCATLTLWLLLRITLISFKKTAGSISYRKEIILLLFVVYTAFVISITLLPVPITRMKDPDDIKINVTPVVNTLQDFIYTLSPKNRAYRRGSIENIIGNIILFIPLGILTPLISTKFYTLKRIALLAFCCSLSIELMQLISREFGNYRTVDIDDVILPLGGIAGFIILRKLLSKKKIKELLF